MGEYALALQNVRKLGSYHQEEFVNSLCDTFEYLNGEEPTINDLAAIFGRIKEQFAEEAIEDDLECDLSDDDEEDSDYDPDDSDYDPSDPLDVEQAQIDQELDCEESESAQNTEDEDEENADWIYGADEESILNADDFDSEYFEAIDCARKQAQIDGEKILSIISEQFEQETGDQATEEMLEQALDTFAESDIEE